MPGTVNCCRREVRTGLGVGVELATVWAADFGEEGAAAGVGFLASEVELDKVTDLEGMAADFAPAGTGALTGNFLVDETDAALAEGLTAFLTADSRRGFLACVLPTGMAFCLVTSFAGAFLAGGFFATAFFIDAFLTGAFFSGAFLTGAFFIDAFLTGAFFNGAFFVGGLFLTPPFLASAPIFGGAFFGAFAPVLPLAVLVLNS